MISLSYLEKKEEKKNQEEFLRIKLEKCDGGKVSRASV